MSGEVVESYKYPLFQSVMDVIPRALDGQAILEAAILLCCSTTPGPERQSKMITIDEFRKLELRVGVVKSAEAHPNADKLLVLKVDLGSEERQIVAGIRAHYQPEELVGKQVVVVANLETATLRGLESQGMVLAASSDDGRVVVLTPEKTVNAGAKVS
jgi:methionine--tRNA ligase beta chain